VASDAHPRGLAARYGTASTFRGPITRPAAGDADRLRREVRHVVLHEIAHHFGISDARLIELDRD
jgi:predicted Zn-dependent protease with MMP-like domain